MECEWEEGSWVMTRSYGCVMWVCMSLSVENKIKKSIQLATAPFDTFASLIQTFGIYERYFIYVLPYLGAN
jgi:hypothetical protein